MKYVLMGIGNELKGDDGIGNVIAREFKNRDWLSLPCETVPENFTGVVERERPEILVIVDAADMGLEAGEFRLVPHGKLGSAGFGTHGMPLTHLVSNLEKHAGNVMFIGIQPGNTQLGEGISPVVEDCKKRLMKIFESHDWETIKSI